ncbi:opsin-5-like [Ruditapes philippinarum]|uniref:opsin-5-like n=1 Tax=Ruditapes philippinarum TaxID=129788 RepID=UPI00295AD3AE|nr:opsin-5-like [Ruditapes philippinarum]
MNDSFRLDAVYVSRLSVGEDLFVGAYLLLIGCVLFGFFGFFFGIVSIATVTVMGIMRYVSICQPQIKIKSRRCVIISTMFPYIYALVWSCLPLKYFGSYNLEPYGTSCALNGSGQRPFTIIMSMFCICIPLFIIMFAYGQIILRYRKSGRNIRKLALRKRRKSRKESFLLKITFIMFWSFLLSWLPYMIASLQTAHGTQSIRFAVFATLMSRTSTVLNPIIYFLMSKKFRPLLVHTCSFSKSLFSPLQRLDKLHSFKIVFEIFNVHNWIVNSSSSEKVDKLSCSDVRKVDTNIILTGFQESVKV